MPRTLSLFLVIVIAGCAGRTAPTMSSGKPVSQWVEALKGADVRVRCRAVRALGNVGKADAAAIPALIDALGDRDARVRGEAALALLKSGPDAREAVPALTRALKDKNAQVRYYAGKALEKIELPDR